jgi:hypothetical protein
MRAAPPEALVLEHASIPRFFEVGTHVQVSPGAPPVDTTGWPRTLLERRRSLAQPEFVKNLDDASRLFLYSEPDIESRQLGRYALELPLLRPYVANDRVAAYWSDAADAFDFGVDGSQSFGSLTEPGPGGTRRVRRLKALFEPAGTNVQAYELLYDIEDSDLRLFEHKGLIPGLPVAFERFTLYRPDAGSPRAEPEPIAAASHPLLLQLGLLPRRAAEWASTETFEVDGYRVVLARGGRGEQYFLAAPSALASRWYFGAVATDLVIDSGTPETQSSAAHRAAVALFVPGATAGTILSGKVDSASQIAGLLRKAGAFLEAHDGALEDLRRRGPEADLFLRHFAHTFLETHASRRDPRALTDLPYGDHFYPGNARAASADVRQGKGQASALLGLVYYQKRTNDPLMLDRIWGLAESSLEARAPSGAVYARRFDSMLLGTAEDSATGRADALIDNGAVAVSFNHLRLVLESGGEHAPRATWGAFGLVMDGQAQSVDGGAYRFAIDGDSLPRSFRTDQDTLRVARLFTRDDAQVRVRESAELARAIPALRVRESVENIGDTSRQLDEVRLTVGDFFHYSDGSNEIAQNRYGMSPVLDGVPLHVGVWMEGLDQPLWGTDFARGWVDLSAEYHRLQPRYVVVYGYDRAQVYYLPEPADQMLLYNVAAGAPGAAGTRAPDDGDSGTAVRSSKDGYEGWTTLQFRYRVDRRLNAGESYASPPIYSYALKLPLFSADDDRVPDALQSMAPLWTELLDTARHFSSYSELTRHLDALPDRPKAQRLLGALHNSLEIDPASIAMQAAWAEAADALGMAARQTRDPDRRSELEGRARKLRDAALEGARYSSSALTHLRSRFDLMPAYGIDRNYGFHVLVFDWAQRQTGDPRYRDAMLFVADRIASSEQQGGLQITDASKPNYGAYNHDELLRARGANDLDDQGIKLWALRRAFDRTGDPRYRRSAELCIENWIKVRADDDLFFGTSKLFDRYVTTGVEQRRTALGHYALMVGLRAWAAHSARARELYARGLRNVTERHPVHAIATAGAIAAAFPDERVVQFETDAEVAGMFLLALTLDTDRQPGILP